MIYDTHLHTCFSHDSQMSMADVRKKMQQINIGVTITEHLDLNFPEPKAFKLDVAGYFNQYEQFRNEYLLMGVEIGMGLEDVTAYRQMIETYAFDYVLGSIHVVDHVDIYDAQFYVHKTKEEVYSRYLDTTIECLEVYDYIDSLGHIDYIARCASFPDRELHYSDFADRLDRILATLASKEKCLELNTRRLGDPAAAASLLPIYKRFRELGGRWITIGSDAHQPNDIGKHFATAMQLAECCQLRPVWFKRRQMQYI